MPFDSCEALHNSGADALVFARESRGRGCADRPIVAVFPANRPSFHCPGDDLSQTTRGQGADATPRDRSANPALIQALHAELHSQAPTCLLVGRDRLILSASALPALRKALRKFGEKFNVTIRDATAAD